MPIDPQQFNADHITAAATAYANARAADGDDRACTEAARDAAKLAGADPADAQLYAWIIEQTIEGFDLSDAGRAYGALDRAGLLPTRHAEPIAALAQQPISAAILSLIAQLDPEHKHPLIADLIRQLMRDLSPDHLAEILQRLSAASPIGPLAEAARHARDVAAEYAGGSLENVTARQLADAIEALAHRQQPDPLIAAARLARAAAMQHAAGSPQHKAATAVLLRLEALDWRNRNP
jgi:hypothetical protein